MCKEKDKEWISLLEKIENQVSHLLWNRYVFRKFFEIIEPNPLLPKDNPFIVWAWENYLFSAALSVRRLVDKDTRSISFYLLLLDMAKSPEVLSRARYYLLFKDTGFSDDAAYINECFDILVGKGKDHLDSKDILKDLQTLLRITKILTDYVNKMIAHVDRAMLKKIPSIHDLDDSIDYLNDMVKKYYAILHAGCTELLPVAQMPWTAIFEMSWKLPS